VILIETIPPYAEPVSLAEVKMHCRIDPDMTDEDQIIQGYVTAARHVAATYHRQQVVASTWIMYSDGFYTQQFPGGQEWPYSAYATSVEMIPIASPAFIPNAIMRIPFGPVQGVSQIQYIDASGALQTLSSTVYQVDLNNPTARILPAYAQYWPYTQPTTNAVRVTFTAGMVTPFTVSGSVLTLYGGLPPVNGQFVRLSNSGGDSGGSGPPGANCGLPDPLQSYTDYYVVNASGQTCQLSATLAGAPITLNNAGTGTNFIGIVPPAISVGIAQLAAHWYRNREGVSNLNMSTVPLMVGDLLLTERKVQYA
jgi:hypothetical protein